MLDKIDKQIIEALQSDARIPNKDIAEKLKMAPSAISDRLKKLKQRKVITSFETRLNPAKVGKNLLAFVSVRTNEHPDDRCTASKLAELEEVQEVYNVAGEDCYFIKIRISDTKELSDFLRETIGRFDSVVSTRTTIVLETHKETCKIKLD